MTEDHHTAAVCFVRPQPFAHSTARPRSCQPDCPTLPGEAATQLVKYELSENLRQVWLCYPDWHPCSELEDHVISRQVVNARIDNCRRTCKPRLDRTNTSADSSVKSHAHLLQEKDHAVADQLTQGV